MVPVSPDVFIVFVCFVSRLFLHAAFVFLVVLSLTAHKNNRRARIMAVAVKMDAKLEMLPETQTQEIFSLTPSIKSNLVEPNLPWGRLYSTYIPLRPVDLENQTFRLGRSDICDVIITDQSVPPHRLTSISKMHFEICKEDNLIYITDLSKNGTFLNGKLVGKGNKNILQNDDEIAIGIKGLKVYVFKILDSCNSKYLPLELRKKYEVSRTLGVGACGEVKLIFDKITCKPYAVKKIIKGRTSMSNKNHLNHPEKIKSEINILQTLKHPCVIAMKEIVETDESVFIILEYMESELNDLIVSVQRMPEATVKFLFYQMVMAVQYLHENDITHRDLKPENVLLKKLNSKWIVKISDFGLSKLMLINEEEFMNTMCGTPNYVAPEVIDPKINGYTQQVDIWSLGVMLFFMLSQELPFKASERVVLNKNILSANFSFRSKAWRNVSEQAKDLIQKMLVVDPKKRIKVDEIIIHPWIFEEKVMMEQVHDLLFSEFQTDILSSDSDNSFNYPPSKRTKLSSDSY